MYTIRALVLIVVVVNLIITNCYRYRIKTELVMRPFSLGVHNNNLRMIEVLSVLLLLFTLFAHPDVSNLFDHFRLAMASPILMSFHRVFVRM